MPRIHTFNLQQGRVFGVREAAIEVGVHFTTLYRWIKAGEVAFVAFGGTVFVPFIEVERLKREKNKPKRNR